MKDLKNQLKIGAKILIGEKYAQNSGSFKAEQIVTLIQGTFYHYNGLFDECHECPAVWNETEKDFDSIHHLFGNDLSEFEDCEIL